MENGKDGAHEAISTKNRRLEMAYQGDLRFINREYTVPCVVNPLYEDKVIRTYPALAKAVYAQLRTIVTPDTYAHMPVQTRADVCIISAPYECGRVLEADETITVNGKTYVLTTKGNGATTYARMTGAIPPWQGNRDFTPEIQAALRTFPFHKSGIGFINRKEAERERDTAREFQNNGIDSERIIGIYRITEMVDTDGMLRPLSYFKEHGFFYPDQDPVIVVRLMRSNGRLLDPYTLTKINRKNLVAPYTDLVLQEAMDHLHVPVRNFNEYWLWLADKLYRQELPLILNGHETSSGRWEDLARNISLYGEELDLEDVAIDQGAFSTVYTYLEHVERHIGNLETAIRVFGNIIGNDGKHKVDFQDLADILFRRTEKIIKQYDVNEIHRKISNTSRKKIMPTDELKSDIRRSLYDHYRSSIFLGGDHVERYRKKMLSLAGYTLQSE